VIRSRRGVEVTDSAWIRLTRERDELRARLTESEAENDQWQKKLAETWAECDALRAAIEQLRAENFLGIVNTQRGEIERLRTENERLRAALDEILGLTNEYSDEIAEIASRALARPDCC
jgi:predicted nuclease with TOPRIM domain